MEARVQAFTLVDGGQPAERTAQQLAEFVGAAEHTLEIAIYDLRFDEGPLRDELRDAFDQAQQRGVQIRLAYNKDAPDDQVVPPPPKTEPELVDSLPFPTAPIPGVPDLMHHKYVIRDRASLWTGSMNWTADSWTREENVIVTVDSPGLAARYLEDFEQLWTKRDVSKSGKVDLAGVVDLTQIREVLRQWHANGNAQWKEPLLRSSLTRAPFAGKHSTPYRPGSVHDYMHAKVTVADDVVFVGSFNLSHSGEENAENVLEIADSALADQLAAYIDGVRARYPAVAL